MLRFGARQALVLPIFNIYSNYFFFNLSEITHICNYADEDIVRVCKLDMTREKEVL